MLVLTRMTGRGPSTWGLLLFLLLTPSVGFADGTPGRELFESNCAVCHGIDGTATLPNAPHFSKGERMEKTDEELLASVSDGLNIMPPWKGVLNEQEISTLVAYVRSLAP